MPPAHGSSRAPALWVALPWIVAAGCTSTQKAEPGPAASASASAPAPSASTPEIPTGAAATDELRPVYPVDAGPPDPLAQRFCDAVMVLPERRKGECCGTPAAVAEAIGAQCVRALTYALGHKAIALAPAAVDRCVEAVTRATSGCDWVTPLSAPLPPECEGILEGQLAEKAQCRSSLECAAGLRCLGLSTIDLGACGPPRPTGAACNLAADMLVTMTRQDPVLRAHPECVGYCAHSRCEAKVAVGGACTSDVVCAEGRCAAGKCTKAPLPAAGEACTDACAAGARCVSGKCAAPKAEGASCAADAECRGACVHADGGAAGTCARSCPVYTVPPAVEKPKNPVKLRR